MRIRILKSLMVASVAVVVCGPAQQASADLIGDTLTINRRFPNEITFFPDPVTGSVSTTVVAGPGDAVSPQPTLYLINPEANSIIFDFVGTSTFGGSVDGIFDGLEFLGFDDAIQNVTF